MSVVNPVICAFNMNYFDFIKSVKKSLEKSDPIYTLIKKKFPVTEKDTESHIKMMATFLTDDIFEKLCCDNCKVESVQDFVLIHDESTNTMVSIADIKISDFPMSFIYIFALFVYLYKSPELSDSLFSPIMNAIKAIQEGKPIDDIVKTILNDDVISLLKNIQRCFASMEADLENTKIGGIAKEIAADLKLDELGLTDPTDLFKGKGDLLGKIVSNVSTKLQQKFEDGSIKHDELLKEAMSVIGGMGSGKENIFANMMKTFGGGASDAKRRSSSAARKLRRKLDEKK